MIRYFNSNELRRCGYWAIIRATKSLGPSFIGEATKEDAQNLSISDSDLIFVVSTNTLLRAT